MQESFLPLVGGAELHVLKLAQALQRRGHTVTVLTATPGPSEWEGVSVVRKPFLDRQGRLSVITYPAGLLSVRGLVESHDVVHAHYTEMMSSLVGALAKRASVPVVLTLHGHGTLDSSVHANRRAARWRQASFERATIVVATTPEMRGIAERFVSRDTIRDIPNGVDTHVLKRSVAVHAVGPRLLTLRRLVPKNGVQYLVESMPSLLRAEPNATLAIAGTGPLEAHLRERVQALGLEDCVTFLGEYRNSEVGSIIADSDIAVFPSSAEGFSLAALEVMAVGRPVVASSVGGFLQLLDEGRGVLVPLFDRETSDYNAPLELEQHSYESLANAIVQLWRHPEVMRRMEDDAACWARSGFSWDAVAEQVEHAYRCAMSRVATE